METMPDFQQQSVQKLLENAMNEALASKLLECPDSRRLRFLQSSDVGIVQFDSLPEDMPVENGKYFIQPQQFPIYHFSQHFLFALL
jgi:hypothetical protein